MMILKFQFLSLIFVLIIPRDGNANEIVVNDHAEAKNGRCRPCINVTNFDMACTEKAVSVNSDPGVNKLINVQAGNVEYSKRQYEAESYLETPNRNNDSHLECQSNILEEKDGSRKKRDAGIIPGVLQGSLGAGLLLPTGMKAQLGPEINLHLNQSDLPNLMGKRSPNAGATNNVKYPVQLFVLSPVSDNKTLNDYEIEKIPFAILNSTANNASEFISLENAKNLIAADVINNITEVNPTSKSYDVIKGTVAKNISNVSSLNNITSLANESNTADVLLTTHKDDYFLKNQLNNFMNKTYSVPLLHNKTYQDGQIDISGGNHNEKKSISLTKTVEPVKETVELTENKRIGTNLSSDYDKNDDYYNIIEITINEDNYYLNKTDQTYESKPVLSISEGKKKIQYDKYETRGIDKQEKYASEKDKPVNDQTTNTLQYYEDKNEPANFVMSSDGYNKDKLKYNFEDHIANAYPYQKTENLLANQLSYNNAQNLKLIDNENKNNGIQENANIRQALSYPNINQNSNAYYYQSPQNIPENQELYKTGNNFLRVYNINRNNNIQNYEKSHPEFKYVFGDQNTYPYKKPDILVETHKAYSNGNDVRAVYKKTNNDDSSITRNLKLYCSNNKLSYLKVNLNYEHSANPKRIQCCSNQRSPLIKCNGFYRNENTPVSYPSYLYYPSVSRNVQC